MVKFFFGLQIFFILVCNLEVAYFIACAVLLGQGSYCFVGDNVGFMFVFCCMIASAFCFYVLRYYRGEKLP